MEDETTPEETDFERVHMKTGRVEKLKASHWGGANISVFMGECILKVCADGVEYFSLKNGEWTVITTRNHVFHRACGYSKLNETQLLIYGGYNEDEDGVSDCFLWNVSLKEKSSKIL